MGEDPIDKKNMATQLTKPISRETNRTVQGRNIIVTLAPAGNQNEALIGLRLKGQRTTYVAALSSVYQMAALWHGQKLTKAKKEARKNGIPWRKAKRDFDKSNSIFSGSPVK